MANLRVNNVVGFGSTDAGVNFTGPIKLNTQGYMYFPTGVTTDRGRGRAAVGGGYDGSSVRDEIEYFNIFAIFWSVFLAAHLLFVIIKKPKDTSKQSP